MTTTLPSDFREFLRLLSEKNVKYLIVGGYAVGYHGYPRSTGDMDVWVDSTEENADRLVQALKAFGFDVPKLDSDLFVDPDRVVRMGHPPLRIEILTSVTGVSFEECYSSRVEEELEDGTPIHFIGLEKLKENKRASGRHKDLDDLENLP
jgi:predicted nucleotidyltransferase